MRYTLLNALDKAIILWYDICKKSERGKSMDKIEKVIKGVECCIKYPNEYGDCLGGDCPYGPRIECLKELMRDTIALLEANKEEIMALRRLVEWAEECGFGLDNIYWEDYVKPEELEGMAYIEQLIYIAKKAGKKDE